MHTIRERIISLLNTLFPGFNTVGEACGDNFSFSITDDHKETYIAVPFFALSGTTLTINDLAELKNYGVTYNGVIYSDQHEDWCYVLLIETETLYENQNPQASDGDETPAY